MEQEIMASTKRKYTASFHTPFMIPPLVNNVGYLATGHAAEEILDGTYSPHDRINRYTRQLLQQLQRPALVEQKGNHPTSMPLETYCNYWKKSKERKSCFPGALSFSTLKAGSRDETIATFKCIMTRIPIFRGYTPNHWKKCLDIMITKKAGLIQVDSLGSIVVFQPDCNYAFKFLGREMMAFAEKNGTLAPEQFGSRRNHCAIDQAVNKVLTNNNLRQGKCPGTISSNDAKSCYDLIVHAPAILSMHQQGVPESTTLCMFQTFQEAQHYVHMAFGDSDTFFRGYEIIPMHGIGRGNGSGPAIWQ